jgi:hypothetical protein
MKSERARAWKSKCLHQKLPPLLDPPIEFIKFPNPSMPAPRRDPLTMEVL